MNNLKTISQNENQGVSVPAVWGIIPGKGRGVVATRDISAGELVEHSPVILMEKDKVEGTPLDEYVYCWDGPGEEKYAVCSGLLMLYNHSSDPNIRIDYDYDLQTALVFALKPIKAGQELCWDYNTDLWFDAA